MNLLENPFYLLGASTRDNRKRIFELYEERSLKLDPRECQRARSDLNTPKKRLAAEVAWLPGLEPLRASQLVALLNPLSSSLLDIAMPHVAKANLLASGLTCLTEQNYEIVASWFLELAWAFEEANPRQLHSMINVDRALSEYWQVADPLLVEEELVERRRYYQQVIQSSLNALSPECLVESVTLAVKVATINGRKHGPVLIDDLVDFYESKTLSLINREAAGILHLVERIRESVASAFQQNVNINALETATIPQVAELIQCVKEWDVFVQPIQVSSLSRGLEHRASVGVALTVRSLAVDLTNEHGMLNVSRMLTTMLGEVFAEVGKIAEMVEKDMLVLEGLEFERRFQ